MMKLLLSSVLLACLCTLSSWSVSSSDPLVVTQEADVSAMEGDTVNITCCWTGEVDKIRIKWIKNHSEIDSIVRVYTQRSSGENTSDCSVLTLKDVTKEDSGRYTCRLTVEIPKFHETEGNSTVITVTEKKNMSSTDRPDSPTSDDNNFQLPVIISVAIVAPLILITLVCFCILRQSQAQAARVIYEVPHIDSELADMDKHSTSSSRGSSQWCQVPVYESFDYFERVQTKESG